MPRPKIRGALAAMLDEAEREIVAELRAEEEARKARRAEISRANLVRARAARQDARQRGRLLIG